MEDLWYGTLKIKQHDGGNYSVKIVSDVYFCIRDIWVFTTLLDYTNQPKHKPSPQRTLLACHLAWPLKNWLDELELSTYKPSFVDLWEKAKDG